MDQRDPGLLGQQAVRVGVVGATGVRHVALELHAIVLVELLGVRLFWVHQVYAIELS